MLFLRLKQIRAESCTHNVSPYFQRILTNSRLHFTFYRYKYFALQTRIPCGSSMFANLCRSDNIKIPRIETNELSMAKTFRAIVT